MNPPVWVLSLEPPSVAPAPCSNDWPTPRVPVPSVPSSSFLLADAVPHGVSGQNQHRLSRRVNGPPGFLLQGGVICHGYRVELVKRTEENSNAKENALWMIPVVNEVAISRNTPRYRGHRKFVNAEPVWLQSSDTLLPPKVPAIALHTERSNGRLPQPSRGTSPLLLTARALRGYRKLGRRIRTPHKTNRDEA